jgi:cobalt-zinc-cadmium efflux system outer membrane protein
MKFRLSFLLFFMLHCSICVSPAVAASPEPAQDLPAPFSFSEALSRVFRHNPELTISELEIQAASARILQAGKRPNPEIETEIEDLALPGIGSGLFHLTETTVQYSQRLELGGKREARVRAAEKEVAVASGQLEVRKTELIAAASRAFVEILIGQQRVANRQELKKLAERSYQYIAARVEAGKASPVEQTRASLMLASAQLEEEKSIRELTAARDRLAAMWGGSHEDINAVAGVFELPAQISGARAACLQNNADIRLAESSIDARQAALDLEIANRKPDLSFRAGLRRLNVENEQVLMAGISMPLPIFDKREGAIAEARVRIEQSRSERMALQRRQQAALTQALHEYDGALAEANRLRTDLIPRAKEAVAALEDGYQLGKMELMDVLDAERTYADLQNQYIDTIGAGLKAGVEIERLARCGSDLLPNSGK